MPRRINRPPAGTLTAVAALVSCLAILPITRAQELPITPEAALIAGWIEGFYASRPRLRTRFEQLYHHRAHDRDERSRGLLVIHRPGRLRIEYVAPRGRLVVSDGTIVRSFDPEPEPGVVYEQQASESAIPATLAMLTAAEGSSLVTTYALRTIDASARGARGVVLELRPLVPTPWWERALLYVDAAEATRGQVRRVLVVDQPGNTCRFDLLSPTYPSSLVGSLFTFDPPADARLIQP